MDVLNQQASIGVPEIDLAHQLLKQALEQLANTDDVNLPSSYMALVAMLEQDFHLEENLMESYSLPSLQLHREQHARVLSGLHHAQPRIMAGDLNLGRNTLELLPQWLAIHSATMDQVLAAELEISKAAGVIA